jgi:hypothetical protein
MPTPVKSSPEPDVMPTKRIPTQRKKVEKPAMVEAIHVPTKEEFEKAAPVATKAKRKVEPKTAPQTVAAKCPYCSAHHDIPQEKGKGGKPFFMACSKCKKDFAVRFVEVTTYQALVAGFK